MWDHISMKSSRRAPQFCVLPALSGISDTRSRIHLATQHAPRGPSSVGFFNSGVVIFHTPVFPLKIRELQDAVISAAGFYIKSQLTHRLG